MAETETLTGGCLCGAVTCEVSAPYLRFGHCHCGRCRKATGTGHATNLYVEPDGLHWLAGEDELRRFDLPSARSFATVFCRHCGSPLPRLTRSGREVVLPAGSLDREPELRPQARLFWSSRTSWSCADESPRYSQYPEWWRRPATG